MSLSDTDKISCALLSVTTLYLLATFGILLAMVKSNKHAEKTYKESKADTEVSLQLTRDGQVDTQRAFKVAEDQLNAIIHFARAQVTIGGIFPNDEILPQGRPARRVNFALVNAGHTPAIDVQLFWKSIITQKGQPVEWSTVFGERPHPDRLTIGAGQQQRAGVDVLEMTDQEFDALLKGAAELRICGRILYRDIFSTEIRTTELEFLFNPLPHAQWVMVRQTET